MAGVKAWEVFGAIGLTGLNDTVRKLQTFNAIGASAGGTMLGLNKSALLAAGGIGAAGLAVGALATGGVRRFAEFDAAMTESLAIMGDVSDELRGEMVEAARRMGRETIFSAKQAAESYFYLASAGLTAEQSIAALPQVAKFAQAGMFDMATATDLATDAQSALGLKSSDAQENLRNLARITDVLVGANTLANATTEQFSTALTSDAGPAAKAYGVSLEETVAVLAAYADQGVKAEKAGSAFGRLLRLLIPAANQNADAFERWNIEVFDAAGNLLPLADIIQDLEENIGVLSPQMKAAALDQLGFKKRVQQVILPLIGTSDAIRTYNENLGDMRGITDEVSEKQLETLTKQFDLLKGELADASIGVGEFIVEGTNAVDMLKDMRTIVSFLHDKLPDTAEYAGDFFGVIAGAVPGLNLALGAMDKIAGKIEDINASVTSPQFIGTMEALSGPGGQGWARFRQNIHPEKFDIETAEEFQKRLDKMTASLGDQRDLFEARLATGRDVLDLMGQLVELERQAKEELDTGGLLTTQETQLLNMLDTVQQLRDEYGATFGPDRRNVTVAQPRINPITGRLELPGENGPMQLEPLPPLTPIGVDKQTKAFVEKLKTSLDRPLVELDDYLKAAFQDIGANAIRGLIDGSLSLGEFLKSSFIDLASGFILGPLTGFLGIASPSRVTAEMGRQMVAGFEVGIAEAAASGGVAQAWAGMLNRMEGARSVARGVSPGPTFDFSKMPPAKNPLAAARDREWQEFFRRSADTASRDGHVDGRR